jgi:hypothetical protein
MIFLPIECPNLNQALVIFDTTGGNARRGQSFLLPGFYLALAVLLSALTSIPMPILSRYYSVKGPIRLA